MTMMVKRRMKHPYSSIKILIVLFNPAKLLNKHCSEEKKSMVRKYVTSFRKMFLLYLIV